MIGRWHGWLLLVYIQAGYCTARVLADIQRRMGQFFMGRGNNVDLRGLCIPKRGWSFLLIDETSVAVLA